MQNSWLWILLLNSGNHNLIYYRKKIQNVNNTLQLGFRIKQQRSALARLV